MSQIIVTIVTCKICQTLTTHVTNPDMSESYLTSYMFTLGI